MPNVEPGSRSNQPLSFLSLLIISMLIWAVLFSSSLSCGGSTHSSSPLYMLLSILEMLAPFRVWLSSVIGPVSWLSFFPPTRRLRFSVAWGFLPGMVAGPVHNPPPFASWARNKVMANLLALLYSHNFIVDIVFTSMIWEVHYWEKMKIYSS